MNNFNWSNCYIYFMKTQIDDNNNFISFINIQAYLKPNFKRNRIQMNNYKKSYM